MMWLHSVSAPAAASSLPPEGYDKPDFVGRDGCLYSKAVVGDWEIWVQRLDDEKRPVCGLTPTGSGGDAFSPRSGSST